MQKLLIISAILLQFAVSARAAENLRLNPKLDYSSDSHDGALISGDKMDEAAVAGKPNYAIFYGEACFNSKRQARRTVSLYEKYKGRVHFVVVDLDQKHTPEQQELINKYYRGYIPHVVVLDAKGSAAYNQSGEVEEGDISIILDKLLR